MKRIGRALAAVFLLAAGSAATGQHLKWASQSDAPSLDPHFAIEPLANSINAMVYERLTWRDNGMATVPRLATSWENPAAKTWIFHLRKGVRFHDGSPFTADDVVFSFERARHSGGTFNVFAQYAGRVRRIDDHTVEFTTPAPNPLIPEIVSAIPVMSRAWCEKVGATRPMNLRGHQEGRVMREAMGTGPFILVARDVGVKTLHRRNPDWWGSKAGLYTGNLETVEHRPIASAATRMAALKSGAVDFVWDPSLQDATAFREDPDIRVWEVPENRLVFVGFDQNREELLHSDVKGSNPFKDRRVRRALYQAIDVEALKSQVMRGFAVPTAIPLNNAAGLGAPALEKRQPYDRARAQALLAEAGYPDGFAFRLNCTTDRFLNDERLCTALAAMWARVGLRVHVEATPRAVFGQKAYARDVTAFLMSFGGAPETFFMLRTVLRSPGVDGEGDMNFGNARLPELDALVDRIAVEMDAATRQQMINHAVRLVQDEVHIIPLHRQVVAWAARRNVTLAPRADNVFEPAWVKIQ